MAEIDTSVYTRPAPPSPMDYAGQFAGLMNQIQSNRLLQTQLSTANINLGLERTKSLLDMVSAARALPTPEGRNKAVADAGKIAIAQYGMSPDAVAAWVGSFPTTLEAQDTKFNQIEAQLVDATSRLNAFHQMITTQTGAGVNIGQRNVFSGAVAPGATVKMQMSPEEMRAAGVRLGPGGTAPGPVAPYENQNPIMAAGSPGGGLMAAGSPQTVIPAQPGAGNGPGGAVVASPLPPIPGGAQTPPAATPAPLAVPAPAAPQANQGWQAPFAPLPGLQPDTSNEPLSTNAQAVWNKNPDYTARLAESADAAKSSRVLVQNMLTDMGPNGENLPLGPNADLFRRVASGINQVADMAGLPDNLRIKQGDVADLDSLHKYALQLAETTGGIAGSGVGASTTDQKQRTAQAANPGPELSRMGTKKLLEVTAGNMDTVRLRNAMWLAYQQDPGFQRMTYAQFDNQFNKTVDPRVLQYAHFDAKERKEFVDNMTPAMRNTFAENIAGMMKNGYLTILNE